MKQGLKIKSYVYKLKLKKYGNKLKMVPNGYCGIKINVKAYGIPIVTTITSCISYKPDEVRLR